MASTVFAVVRRARACLIRAATLLLAVPAAAGEFPPVTDAMLKDPPPGDWLMWRRTYDAWGYSPLEAINRDNVDALTLEWSADLEEGIQEGTPLAYRGTLYMPNPGDVIRAMNGATGEVQWEYRRQMPEDLGDYISANTTNRALAIHGDRILYTSNDDYIVALDARTGQLRWETEVHDYQVHPAQQSNGPVVIEGLAVSGRGCMPVAGPEACVITAHDTTTGEEVWRLHTIEKPVDGEPDSWGDVPWEGRWHVGAWMMPSYDPDLKTLYMGTSVTAPAPKFLLAGNELQYLYHNSTLAVDPADGRLKWHYQHVVDHWDLDHPFERLLVDSRTAPDPDEVPWINPDLDPEREYKLMTGIPGKTGLVYTLDRETGEFLWARPTVHQNVVGDIDGASGRVSVNPGALFSEPGQSAEICPGPTGGKNWMAGAYSPQTKLMYYPLQNTCSNMTVTSTEAVAEELYGVFGRNQLTPGEDNLGTVQAISVETGERAWIYEMPGTSLSLLATAGGLVFGGDIHGNFRALDQDTGEVLWETNLGSPVTGYPISYSAEGRQYIAVSTGNSVTTSGQRSLVPDLAPHTENRLYVFALPQR